MKIRKLLFLILAAAMLLGCISLSVFADTVDYLDLESGETYLESGTIDQTYTLIDTNEYVDKTKVKVSWELTEIALSRTVTRTWNPDTMQWDEVKGSPKITDTTASFTFTNYSSKVVVAKVDFAVGKALAKTFDKVDFTNNNCCLATPVVKDTTTTYQNSDFTAKTQTITATLTLKNDAFADLSAATAATKYGTYTVTIGEYIPVTSVAFTNASEQVTIGDEKMLTATVLPENASDKIVSYSSSAESVATVDKDGKVTVLAAGETVITATAADGKTSTCTITVVKKIPDVTAPKANGSLTYTGDFQELVSAGSAVECTVKYAVSDSEPADEDYSADIPQRKDAGTYKVWYKSFGNVTYKDSEAGSITVSIAKATQTAPSAPTSADAIIDATSITLTDVTKGSSAVGDVEYAYNTSDSAPSTGWQTSTSFTGLSELTEYYFFARYTGSENYASIVSASTKIKTHSAKPAPTFKAPTAVNNLSYTGKAQTLFNGGSADGGTMKYAYGSSTAATEEYSTTIAQKTNGGTYYLWYKVEGDAEHANVDPACVSVTVASIANSMTLECQGICLDEIPAPTATVLGGTVSYSYYTSIDGYPKMTHSALTSYELEEACSQECTLYVVAYTKGNENYGEAMAYTSFRVSNYLTFMSKQDGSTIWLWGDLQQQTGPVFPDEPPQSYAQYKTNNSDWQDCSGTITLNDGEWVSFRAQKMDNKRFVMSGKFYASGHVTSLLNGEGGDVNLNDYGGLGWLFYDCGALVTAPKLPSTSLSGCCYEKMFYNCSSLTKAPELPATWLAEKCYSAMFYGCSALTTAPELPATFLAKYCYASMFKGCSSLIATPTLSESSLEDYCYENMFEDCSKLETACDLPATFLPCYCYSNMFAGCSSLKVTPKFTAITLYEGACTCMFDGCSSLVKAPVTLRSTNSDWAYYHMFYNCSKLKIGVVASTADIPSGGTLMINYSGTNSDAVPYMFGNTAGTFKGTPTAGKKYYWYTE